MDFQSHFNALLGRDWIHSNLCVPLSLPSVTLFWNGNNVETMQTDKRMFVTKSNATKVMFYYNNNMSPTSLVKHFVKGFPTIITVEPPEEVESKEPEEALRPLVSVHTGEFI